MQEVLCPKTGRRFTSGPNITLLANTGVFQFWTIIPSRTRRGCFTLAQNQRMHDVVETTTSRLKKMAERLSQENSVFDDQATSMVEQVRPLLDLQRLAKKIKLRGSSMIGSVEAETFVSNGKKIASNIIQIPNVELAAQYKEFFSRLEKVTNGIQEKDLPENMEVFRCSSTNQRGFISELKW